MPTIEASAETAPESPLTQLRAEVEALGAQRQVSVEFEVSEAQYAAAAKQAKVDAASFWGGTDDLECRGYSFLVVHAQELIDVAGTGAAVTITVNSEGYLVRTQP